MNGILTAEHVSHRFGSKAALNDVSLSLMAGTLTGIIGPNGAGKTTLLRTLTGLLRPNGGQVEVHGKPLSAWRRDALARTLAYAPQGGDSSWPMLVEDVVMLGRIPYLRRFAAPGEEDTKAVADALTRCDATGFAGRSMNTLSAGERARVLLARALATGADILLTDEPAAFLDPAHQFALMELLRAEAARGTAVIVTLHDLPLAARYCDRLVIMDHGAIAADAPPEEALSTDNLARVFALTRAEDGQNLALMPLKPTAPRPG